MPTYAYFCEPCGHRYEKREGFEAPAKQKCPACGRKTSNRVLFAPPVVFKGGGFYKTDNRGSSRGGDSSSTADGDGASTSKDGDKAAAKADATPAAAGHGHSHGAGGHSHDTPPAPADSAAAS